MVLILVNGNTRNNFYDGFFIHGPIEQKIYKYFKIKNIMNWDILDTTIFFLTTKQKL